MLLSHELLSCCYEVMCSSSLLLLTFLGLHKCHNTTPTVVFMLCNSTGVLVYVLLTLVYSIDNNITILILLLMFSRLKGYKGPVAMTADEQINLFAEENGM